MDNACLKPSCELDHRLAKLLVRRRTGRQSVAAASVPRHLGAEAAADVGGDAETAGVS
jgi:hypothetical protein